jgi:hypothetical protein
LDRLQLAAKRSGLTDEQQRELDETLADIATYQNVTEEHRDVCRRNAVSFAQLKALQTERALELPLAKVLPFKPRPA